MATTTSEERLYLLITEMIPLIEAKITQLEQRQGAAGTRRGVPNNAGEMDLDNLETLAVRLQRIKSWLENDPTLKTVLNQHLTTVNEQNQQREASRAWSIAIVTTIIGVVLGWLSSLLAAPATLWHLLGH